MRCVRTAYIVHTRIYIKTYQFCQVPGSTEKQRWEHALETPAEGNVGNRQHEAGGRGARPTLEGAPAAPGWIEQVNIAQTPTRTRAHAYYAFVMRIHTK